MQAGMFLAQKELYSPAAEVFKRCAHDYPELFESHYNLALARYALKQFPEAFLAIERAPAGSAPQEVARHYLRGKIEGALQRNAEATEDLEMAFRSNPQQENYALDLGLLYLQRQQYPKAAKVFDGGTRLNPQSVYLWFGLALTLFLEGRTEQCLSTGEHLLALRPDFTPASLLLAFVLTINGKLAEAEKMAAQGLNSPHPHPFLYYLHASILLRLHSKDDAQILRELTTAERAVPSCSLCALAKGKLEEARSDFPAAITDMERATREDPAFPDPWYHLATLYARSGRRQEAELARRRFSSLKAESESRETQAFRKVLLESLSESSDAF
jgi:tetratricopeptide (TPR) repeat protein